MREERNALQKERQQLQRKRNEAATEVREEIKEQRQEVRNKASEASEEVKQTIKDQRDAVKKTHQEARDALRETLAKERAQHQESVEQKKTELKDRLKVIKDERKKEIVERVANNINQLNERSTNHLLNVLEHLDDILAKVRSRSEKAKQNGRNVSEVTPAIDAASSTIVLAQEAVRAQAAKVYNISVEDEATLRNVVGAARQQLENDIKAARGEVREARDRVHSAFEALRNAISQSENTEETKDDDANN